jgi:hypothetical protein
MTDTVYRFLPWSRRGLSAAMPTATDGAPVPARAEVKIEVVVGGVGTVPTTTTLYGPGDVVGLDPTVIVRTIPRPHSTNVEPNYLAAVDFDQPELPWLFTPTGVPASGRLKPWLVLVVVKDRPGVSVTVPAGAVLPHLKIESGAAAELPDLAESWAWAHVQLLDGEAGAGPQAVGKALADRPDHNVSRLLCPRRLEPNCAWFACLVPAFDAGVVRGLGGTPDAADLAPAWTAPDTIELPVYYHWRFQTGPQGDFESLARRLRPYESGARIGRVKMHVGAPTPYLDPITGPDRFLDMDGALRAPAVARTAADPPVPDPALSDVPTVLRQGLRNITRILADAADGRLDQQAPEETTALGPPVYNGAHVRRSSVTDDDATWFQEINTDPRGRVAAGLGAEVLRKYQEDVVESCWQQVGDIIGIQTVLSRARLSLEASLRFNARHLLPLPPGRYLQVTAPLKDRTLVSGRSLPDAIASTSFPDRTTDPALRRFTASRGQILTAVVRRAVGRSTGDAVTAAARAAADALVTRLAAGRADVDATRFPVVAVDGLPASLPEAGNDGQVRLDVFGARVAIDKASATALGQASKDLRSAPVLPAADSMKVRPDLRTIGLVTSAQFDAAREISAAQTAALEQSGTVSVKDTVDASPTSVLDKVLTAAGHAGASGFLVQTGRTITVTSLALGAGGRLVAVTPDGSSNVTVATLDRWLTGSASEVGEMVGQLPKNALGPLVVGRGGSVASSRAVRLGPGAGHAQVVVHSPGGPAPAAPPVTTITLPPLVKDSAVIDRYERAISRVVVATVLGVDPVVPRLVPFALSSAVVALRERSDPAVVHPARLDTMISVAGYGLASILAEPSLVPAWLVQRLFDRVMAYPKLDLPAYAYLADYDRTRFCPSVDEVPPDSITLLETNPRFIAAFMGGLNHETNKELLWRGFPSDGRGTPWRRFWQRSDATPDIYAINTWGARAGRDDLPAQTTQPESNLVLLVRGDLLRRYPNTMVIAVKAESDTKPSDDPADLRMPDFAGRFDPDVSFFGFPLVSADLTTGAGWFFGLVEPVTEPRFGFDETVNRTSARPTTWNDVAWPDLGVAPAGLLSVAKLSAFGLTPAVGQADGVAAALFQRPFKLLVHAKHLVKGV